MVHFHLPEAPSTFDTESIAGFMDLTVAAAAEAYVALDICAGTVRDICADTGTVRDMYAVTFREPDCTLGVAVAPVIQAK